MVLSSRLPRRSDTVSLNIRVSAGRREIIAAQGRDRDEQVGDQERREHVRDPDLLAFEQPKLRPTIRMPPMTVPRKDPGLVDDGVRKFRSECQGTLHEQHRPDREQHAPPEHEGERELRDKVQVLLRGSRL